MSKIRAVLTSNGVGKKSGSLAIRCMNELRGTNGCDLVRVPIAYIDTAMSVYPEKIQDFVQWILGGKQKLRMLGADLFHVRLDEQSEPQIRCTLDRVEIVYIDGGSVGYLLNHACKKHFGEMLADRADRLIVVGCSAGSMILGQDVGLARLISYPGEEPGRYLANDSRGLGLVPLNIYPHYNDRLRRFISCLHGGLDKQPEHWLYKLRDGEVLVVGGDAEPRLVCP